MARNVSRTLHYRHAGFLVPSSFSLEEILRAALALSPLALDRERNLGDSVFQILNSTATVGTTLCCALHRWVQGQHQLIVERDPAAKTWTIQEVPPPPGVGAQGAQRDFLPFSLYFGVRGNHVVVLQSQGLMAPELGHYLIWFLAHKVPHLFLKTQSVTMYPASASMLRAKGVDKAKAILIERPLADIMERPPVGKSKKTLYEKVVPTGRAKAFTDVLNSMGIPAPRALLASNDSKDLDVRLEIRRSRGNDPMGNPVMNEIGKLVAEQDDDGFIVELLDGSELKGSQLKLSESIEVSIPDNLTHPSEISIFTKIDLYLHRLIQSGMV